MSGSATPVIAQIVETMRVKIITSETDDDAGESTILSSMAKYSTKTANTLALPGQVVRSQRMN
jgi:hypothetical protein